MNKLRLWLPTAALAALTTAGCMLVSGQFTVTFDFADPLTVVSPTQLAGIAVNLNDESDYADHKGDLKDVADLAIVGKVTNLTGTATSVEVWMVANPGGALLLNEDAVKAAGQKIWGTLNVPANGTVQVTWNKSAALFTGRKALVDQIKGDGRFDLYALGSGGAYSFRINKGALIAVIAAGK